MREALLSESQYHSFVRGTMRPYYMNYASKLLIDALAIEDRGDIDVLDLCAAPGGKSLLVADAISDASTLHLNDLSRSRVDRLRRVFAESFGADERITISVGDGTRWGMHNPEHYDLIILDAPCSSEGHVLSSSKKLSQWGPARIKRNAQTQHALLCSAWDALRPGGLLMYSTCALAERENDGAVAALGKKREGVQVAIQPPRPGAELALMGEKTEHGWLLLPDHNEGIGPLYVSYLSKKF